MIKAIDKNSVHQICSGQVVLTLAVAIKELVENSLDAGATHIEVRLKSNGLKSIQVTDNGSGILEADFEGLTLKHHTSKISDFSDLPGVSSFGFRGEALSSLCALSDLSIHTRHSTAAVGTRLEFSSCGAIKTRSPAPRGQPGTTMQVTGLFAPLPVRRREFERNARREVSKAVQLMTAYCLVRPDVRLLLTNQQNDAGTSTTLLSTDGRGASVRDSLSAVFGPRTLQALLPLEENAPLTEALREEFRVKTEAQGLSLHGWISSPVHGSGRSSPDRQFFYVNGRPCALARLARLVNDAYRELNRHQYPLVFLELRMAKNDVDVNVTPDKRSIFFDHETHVLALAKATLRATFSRTEGSVAKIAAMEPSKEASASEEDFVSVLKRRLAEAPAASPKQRRLSFPKLNTAPHSQGMTSVAFKPIRAVSLPYEAEKVLDSSGKTVTKLKAAENDTTCDPSSEAAVEPVLESSEEAAPSSEIEEKFVIVNEENKETTQLGESSQQEDETSSNARETSQRDEESSRAAADPQTAALLASLMEPGESCADVEVGGGGGTAEELSEADGRRQEEAAVPFSLWRLRERLSAAVASDPKEAIEARKFLAKISPEENERAEAELQRNFRKEDFLHLEVIGQFNLGFIVARIEHDLFIVDQHATDEKFNFERLEREHHMKFQKLLSPMALELSASQEMTLLDNCAVFEKNGFRFEIDDKAPMGRRVHLASMPVSRSWTFGVEDIEEMIFVIDETGSNNCRPSKVRRMLASRACRSSVMIGTALTAAEMARLLRHMADMEQPWNCPHGRPTMRHLLNLQLARLVLSEVH